MQRILPIISILLGFSLTAQNQAWQVRWQNPALLDTTMYANTTLLKASNSGVYAVQNYYIDNTSYHSAIYRISNAGNILWTKFYGFPIDLAVSRDESIYIVSNFKDSLVVGQSKMYSAGEYDCLLLKLDTFGNVVQLRELATTGSEYSRGLCMDAQGPIVFLSHSSSMILNADTLDSQQAYGAVMSSIVRFLPDLSLRDHYDLDCQGCESGEIRASAQGDLYFLSGFSGINFGDTSMTGGVGLFHLTPSLKPARAKLVNGGGPVGFSFELDGSQNIILEQMTGYNTGSTFQTSLIKLDSSFTTQWTINYNQNPMKRFDSNVSLDLDPQNNIYLAGNFVGTYGYSNYSHSLAKMDPQGNVAWMVTDSIDSLRCEELCVTDVNQLYVGGRYTDSVTYDMTHTSGDFVALYSTASSFIRPLSETQIIVFPNPSDGLIKIIAPVEAALRLIDLRGACKWSRNTLPGETVCYLGCDPGLYVLECVSGNRIERKKIVIK